METSILKQKFKKRKFWFPVGVFSLILLPLLLYQNLHNKIENAKSYCQEVELSDVHFDKITPLIKITEVKIKDNSNISSSQIQFIIEEFNKKRPETDQKYFFNIYAEIITPESFNYQSFISFNDSLEKFNEYNFAYQLNERSIYLFRRMLLCGTPSVNKSTFNVIKSDINWSITDFIIFGICFPALIFFNFRKIKKIRKNRKHFLKE